MACAAARLAAGRLEEGPSLRPTSAPGLRNRWRPEAPAAMLVIVTAHELLFAYDEQLASLSFWLRASVGAAVGRSGLGGLGGDRTHDRGIMSPLL